MRRKIVVQTPEVSVIAWIQTDELRRDEVERLRDQLADRLQKAVSDLIYLRTPRNRVSVR